MVRQPKLFWSVVLGVASGCIVSAQTASVGEMSLEQYLGVPPLSSYTLPRIPFIPRQDPAPTRSFSVSRSNSKTSSKPVAQSINNRTATLRFTPRPSLPEVISMRQLAALPNLPASGESARPDAENPPTVAPVEAADSTLAAIESANLPAPQTADPLPESLAQESEGSVPSLENGDDEPDTSIVTELPRLPNPNRVPYKRSNQRQPTATRYLEIQQALNERGYIDAPMNGQWGPVWVDALKRFQTDQGLTHDGKLGALTLTALGLGPRSGDRPALATNSSSHAAVE